MKKNIRFYCLFLIAIFFISINVVKADSYEFTLVPYNVSTACDLELDGGQVCFEKYLKGELDSYEITNGIVEANENVMLITKVKPSSDSKMTGIQYAINHDNSKVSYYYSSYGEEYGLLATSSENLGYTYNFFPTVVSGRNTLKTWNSSGSPVVGDSSISSIIYTAGEGLGPLVKETPLSATFYTVNSDVTPGSDITFEFDTDPSETDIADPTSSLTSKATFSPLTLSVLSNVSVDGTLKSLTATGSNGLAYTFGFIASSKANLNYSFKVPNSVTTITFAGTPTDSNIKSVIGLDTAHSLSVGDNDIKIAITAESGDITYYSITVRRLSNDATLSSISATNGVSFGSLIDGTYTYNTTVPYKTTDTFTTALTNHSDATITEGLGTWNISTDNSTDKLNVYKVNVDAENCKYASTEVPGNICTTQEYTFNITRKAPSKNVNLSDLKVDGTTIPGFSPDKYTYTLTDVAYAKTSINITATLDDPLNTITSGLGTKVVNVGNNVYNIIVTSEDGITTQTYTINLYRKSNETRLQSLLVSSNPSGTLSPSFNSTFTGDYTYTYDPNVTDIDIAATVKDTGKAKVSIVDLTNGSNILIDKQLNSANVTVGITTKKIGVIVTPEDDDTEPITYTINLERQKSSNNYLSSLNINPGTINETFSPTKGSYTAIVDADVTSTVVTATLADKNATLTSITGNSGFEFGSGNVISIVVTSEDGKVNTYTINVTRKQYDIATLDDIKVGFGDNQPVTISGFNKDVYSYDLYTQDNPLAFEIDSINIQYSKTNSYSVVTGDSGAKAVQTGDNTYSINVTSQDGTQSNTYIINVYRKKNTDNATRSVSVAGISATTNVDDPNNYYVTLPNTKNSIVPSEVIISASDDATIVKITGNLELSTSSDNVFQYSITSEDGQTEYYQIHINREKSTDASITTVYLRLENEIVATRSCTFTGSSTTCTITVPEGTEAYYLEPTINPAATVSPVNSTKYTMDTNNPDDSIQTRILTVTAENVDVTKSYTIMVERAKSSNANLSGITLTNVTNGENESIIVPNFNPSKTSYNISVPGTTEDIKVEAILEDSKATINTTIPQIITLSNYGINQFTINVTAEDGKATKAYILNITREEKIDATLKDLKVDGTTISGFSSETTSYVYNDVSYEKTQLTINAMVSDDSSSDPDINAIITSIILNGSEVPITQSSDLTKTIDLKTGDNQIEIVVAAQNRNTTKTYKVNVNRAKNTDTGIQGITVAGITASPMEGSDYKYTVTVPNNITEANQSNVIVTPNNGATLDDAKATYEVTTTPLLTLDSNDNPILNKVNITLTSESGAIKVYEVLVTRTPSDVSTMTSVSLYTDVAPTIPKQCLFTDGTVTCSVNAEMETTSINLVGNLADSTSKVTFTDGLTTSDTFRMSATESTKVITARVVAENNNDYTDYTITVIRAKSSNNYLKEIFTNANATDKELIPDFESTKQVYNLEVPGTQSTIDIYAKALDSKSKVTTSSVTTEATDTIDFTYTLGEPGTNNVIELIVIAEDSSKLTYTINVKRKENIEPRLQMITINGTSIDNFLEDNQVFSPDTYEYTLKEFPYNTDSISIGATNMDTTYGTTMGVGIHSLNTIYYGTDFTTTSKYINTITIKSMAQDKSVYKNYVLKVMRSANNDTDINKVEMLYDGSLHEAIYDNNENVYRITVPNNVIKADSNNVIVTPVDGRVATDALATVTMGETNLFTNDSINGNINSHNFIVTAEDGTVQTYTLIITREKSDNSYLTEILVKDPTSGDVIGAFNPTFKENVYVYNVTVPVTTTDLNVEVTKKEENAVVTGDGKYKLDSSSKQITVVVTPENGDTTKTRTYTLNIIREANNNNNLKTLEVQDIDGNGYVVTPNVSSTDKNYKVTVPGTVDKVVINATAESSLSSITYVNADSGENIYTIPVGVTNIEFKITSESGASQSYYVEVTREPKKDATLSVLTYTLSGGNVMTFDDFDPSKDSYTIPTLPYNESMIYFTAVANDADASVSGDINNQSIATGPNKFEIVVTAEDGVTTKTYTIFVEREKNNDATLKLLSIHGESFNETFDKNLTDYTTTVSETKENIKPTDIEAIPTDSKAKITLDPETYLSTEGINYYKVKVTAEDGVTTKTYTIAITRPKSTDNLLKAINLTGASLSPAFNPTTKEYTIIVPYGQTTFEIEGIPNVSTSKVYGNNTYTLDDKTFNLSVTAEDPNTIINIYKFNIVEAKSNDATLTDLSVSGYPFVGTNSIFQTVITDYTIGSVETSVKKIMINATPSNINSTLKFYNDGDLIDTCDNNSTCEITLKEGLGTKSITVQVIAPDEVTTKSYNISYTKVNSSNAYLASIESSKGTFDKAFNKTTKSYTLSLPYEEDNTTLTLITENSDANIVVNNDTAEFSPKIVAVTDIPAGGSKNVSILVTAQDGVSRESYTIIVERSAYTGSTDANLSSLSVNGYTLSPEFSANTLNYDIGEIPYKLSELTINAEPNISSSKVSYYVNGIPQSSNVVSIPKENATITIKVVAEDNKTTKNYTINYSKQAKSNAYLNGITISEGVLSPVFNKNTFIYNVTLDKDINSLDLTATLEDSNATIKINGDNYVENSVKSITNIPVGLTTITIVTTAEDGTTTLTYKINVTRETDGELITSENYGHTIEDGYIKTIAPLKTVGDVKNELDNDNSKLEIWTAENSTKLSDSDRVGTGMIVKLVIDGTVVDSDLIIIRGDVTGDGEVDIFDSADILNHYVDRKHIVGAYLVAAEVNADGEVDIFDSSDILNHYVGRTLLTYK